MGQFKEGSRGTVAHAVSRSRQTAVACGLRVYSTLHSCAVPTWHLSWNKVDGNMLFLLCGGVGAWWLFRRAADGDSFLRERDLWGQIDDYVWRELARFIHARKHLQTSIISR